jgi:hypothetical protein
MIITPGLFMQDKQGSRRTNITRTTVKQNLALAWYSEEDYQDILEMMADRDDLPETYQEWLDLSLAMENELFRQGRQVVRIMIQPKQFASWCAIQGLKPNGGARAQFAAKQALRKARLN